MASDLTKVDLISFHFKAIGDVQDPTINDFLIQLETDINIVQKITGYLIKD